MRKFLIFLMTAAGLAALLFSHDIPQKNPESIFLTRESLKDYKNFQKDILEKHTLVIKKETSNKDEFYKELEKIQELCVDDCEIVTAKRLQKNTSVASQHDDELLTLDGENFTAALIMDNHDSNLKKILHFTQTTSYWSNHTSFAGIPYTNFLLDKYSLSIQENLFPTMFVMGFIISLVFIGNLVNALVVYLPCLFSAGFSLATLKILFGDMNMVTSIIPLVMFTVALSLSFHLFFSLKEMRTLKEVLRIKKAPIFLMMFTTYIGFLSLGWASIAVIRDFGIISAQLVLFSTLFIFGWYYCWERWVILDDKNPVKPVLVRTQIFVRTLPKWLILMLGLGGVLSVVFIPGRLDIITDATLYFPKSVKIREKILNVTETVSGMPVMEIAVDLGHDFSKEDMLKMKQVESVLLQAKYSRNYKIISNNSLVSKTNQEYSGQRILPETLESYLLLRGQLPAGLQESYPVEKIYRITLLGTPLNVSDYMQDLKVVKNVLIENKLNYQINGIHHNLMLSQNAMIDVLAESFISSMIIIFFVSAFFLRTAKNIFIFMFVSLLPVALTFAGMYLAGFSVNIATVMTFSISLGLVGDSSFHIYYARQVRFNSFDEYSRGVLLPVIGSGLLLFTCFGMFVFNSFLPIRQFGGILAFIMLLGTIVDLYVLPTMLYGTNEHKKAYEKKD